MRRAPVATIAGMPNRPSARLLGGLTPARFLAAHWQKKPLLVRQAIEGFRGLLDPNALMRLAQRDDVEARLVIHRNSRWEVRHGPFAASVFTRLPKAGWSLLVQDVNHFLPSARQLLSRFDFAPHARLDDLMVSYAPPGGGVGPHFDSYDVFLLQGLGRRRWQISRQRDLTLVPDAPLRLLADFRAEQDWVLESGDMLYLPPSCAHDGVALDHCMTYSIGFRAPSWQELATQFLAWLQDEVNLDGMYADPGLRPARSPGRVPDELVERTHATLARIAWDRPTVARFLGCYLTEPKPHVYFAPPQRPLSRERFAQRVRAKGVSLCARTRMLHLDGEFYLNGERERMSPAVAGRLRALADQTWLAAADDYPGTLIDRLYEWYRAGFLEIGTAQ